MTGEDKSKTSSETMKEFEKIVNLHYLRRTEINARWSRVLPFNEEISDRWEKAKYLKFGRGTSIYDSAFVFGDVQVGENTWIGPFTILDGSGGLKIGSFCSISAGVQIYTHDTVKWAVSGGKEPYAKKAVQINDCCFIGPNSIIKAGVQIGEHSVVGALSFVNNDVEPYSIVAGSPAKVIGRVRIADGNVYFDYH